jgi:DNA-directed RNA polymerase beta' subunit
MMSHHSSKRFLTEDEVENILSFIEPQKGIPFEIAMSIVDINKQKYREQLQSVQIYPKMIPKLREQMSYFFEKSKIQAGENVGIVTAQSFGQFQTQSTLNSFHKAGLSEKTVVSGVSRFSEILDTTRSPKSASCVIHFKSQNDSLQSLRQSISHTIVGLELKTICDDMKIHLEYTREPWYDIFDILHTTKYKEYSSCISITVNQEKMFQYSITLQDICRVIENTYADLICVFSPLYMRRIDIFVDTTSISLPEKMHTYVTAENMHQVYLEDVVVPNLEKLLFCGIKGISNMFFTTEQGKWFVETEGSNFSEVLAHPNVDETKSVTNNIWEIYETLGIEAVREYMIEELTLSMTGINVCHSRLLIDKMTFNGTIVSISRYAMRSEGSGPLGRASFEETLDNLLLAAASGERESTDGVSAGIICGKLGKFGTGLCELRIDIKKLANMPSIMTDTVRESKGGEQPETM